MTGTRSTESVMESAWLASPTTGVEFLTEGPIDECTYEAGHGRFIAGEDEVPDHHMWTEYGPDGEAYATQYGTSDQLLAAATEWLTRVGGAR